jgi:hypothetical protein
VDWSVDANVLEKHTVSIFRAEVTMQGIRGIIQSGRKESLKEWTNQDGVRQRFRWANGETPNRHQKRGDRWRVGGKKSALFRTHHTGLIPW